MRLDGVGRKPAAPGPQREVAWKLGVVMWPASLAAHKLECYMKCKHREL